jgi:hypothetical protein
MSGPAGKSNVSSESRSWSSLLVAGAVGAASVVSALLIHKYFVGKNSTSTWSTWCPFSTSTASSKTVAAPPAACPRHDVPSGGVPATSKALTLSTEPAAAAPSAFSVGCPAGFGATSPKHGVPAILVRPKRGDKPVYYHDYLGAILLSDNHGGRRNRGGEKGQSVILGWGIIFRFPELCGWYCGFTGLDKILTAQSLKSQELSGHSAHDEMYGSGVRGRWMFVRVFLCSTTHLSWDMCLLSMPMKVV